VAAICLGLRPKLALCSLVLLAPVRPFKMDVTLGVVGLPPHCAACLYNEKHNGTSYRPTLDRAGPTASPRLSKRSRAREFVLIDEIMDSSDDLKAIQFAGGEPTVNKTHQMVATAI
jgi:hypothetical protein